MENAPVNLSSVWEGIEMNYMYLTSNKMQALSRMHARTHTQGFF